MRAVTALALSLAICCAAAASEPETGSAAEARELMLRVQAMAAAPHEIIELTMELIDAAGGVHERAATLYQQQRAQHRMARLIRFHSPAEMAGAGVLALENTGRDDDWWIYLPAYHTTRRIAPANRGETYMGTDFSYEDLTDLHLDDYDFAFEGWDEVEGVRCRLLAARPTSAGARRHSLYSRRVYSVDLDRLICPRAVFYDREGEPLKEVRGTQPAQVGDRWRWDRTELRNLRTGHATVLTVRARRSDEPIPERLFTERGLRRPG